MGRQHLSSEALSRHLLDVPYCVLRLTTTSYAHDIAMASIMRPGLLRQACTKPAASQRMLSTITGAAINRPLAQQLRPAFQRAAVPKSTRIAAFHATQRNQILPPLPQKIIGTTNDPTPVPTPEYAHGSYHWSFERYAVNPI
jgi:succinate dehydrogenase (ubiquinone) membrane anchor subunit